MVRGVVRILTSPEGQGEGAIWFCSAIKFFTPSLVKQGTGEGLNF